MILSSLAICIACVLLFASNFTKTLDTWVFIVFSETKSLSAISLLDNPEAISHNTSYSRLLRPSSSIFWWLISGVIVFCWCHTFWLIKTPIAKKNKAIIASIISIDVLPVNKLYLLNWKRESNAMTNAAKMNIVFLTL